MNLKSDITIGIGATEEKLKLAAIFFDQIVPIQKEHTVPASLISKIPIDYNVLNRALENDKKYSDSDVKLLQDKILPSFF